VAPHATGTPVIVIAGGAAVVGAFQEASWLALGLIALLLIAVLRRARDILLVLAPLGLAVLFTAASAVLLGLRLNFANVIVLPLLLGIGVAFHIYFVIAWRAGGHDFLQSSLSRAVFFSALTTATGFGTLWLSHHPGTASMGELLMISLAWTLTILFFLPALLETAKAD